jgi:type IV pilus assembly protein PilW
VAIGVFGLVMSVVLQVFRFNYRSYDLQEDVAEMQQNLRVAKMLLSRDIRMAGSGLRGFNHNGAVYAVSNANNVGTGGSDIITIHYYNFDFSCGSGATDCDDDLSQLTLTNTMGTASTSFEVNEPLSDPGWEGTCQCGGTDFAATSAPHYKAVIGSVDGTFADVVFITGINAAGGVLNNDPYSTWGNKAANTYPAGSTINFFTEAQVTKVVYQVTGTILERSAEALNSAEIYSPIAENIEDMQLAFGLDTDADGDTDTWVTNAALTTTQKAQVRLVRLNLLAQTPGIHPMVTGRTFTIEDNNSGAVDNRKRKLLTTTIKVRNLG